MSRSAYFGQDCPTCGRALEVRVQYLGRQVVCPHCRGAFIATDPSNMTDECTNSGIPLLDRANELLHRVETHHWPG